MVLPVWFEHLGKVLLKEVGSECFASLCKPEFAFMLKKLMINNNNNNNFIYIALKSNNCSKGYLITKWNIKKSKL